MYALRTKHDSPYVSVPFSWDELEKLFKKGDANNFLIGPDKVLERIDRFGDLFGPLNTLKQKIPADYLKKVEAPRSKITTKKGRTAAPELR